MLTYTRNVQLIVGIVWDVYIVLEVRGRDEAMLGNWVSIGLLTCYLILHRRDVRMMTDIKKD